MTTAPTYVTKYMTAKHRESEYNGRPSVQEKVPKSAVDKLAKTPPHSVQPCLNAEQETRAARERDQAKEIIV